MIQKQLLCLALISTIYADNLKQLIDYTNINNKLIEAKQFSSKAKTQEVKSVQSSSVPTIDIGGFYQNLNERTPNLAGDIYSGYAKISYDIYDGGRKSSIVKQKQDELKSSQFDTTAFKKSLSLQIVQEFFTIKNIDASILALNEQKISLKAQLNRVQKFYQAQLSTKDDIDKLQSAYDTNNYNIQSLKFQRLTTMQSLELKVGKNLSILDKSQFLKQLDLNLDIDDNIKSLKAKESSLKNLANSVDSAYLPQVNISDTYSINDYGRADTLHPEGLDNQNKLMLSVNLRLFDGGAISKNKQAIMINSKALKTQIEYKIKEQNMLFNLSKSRIDTSNLKIKSSLSALNSANSAYQTIDEKYKAGIVDNVAYLDALSVKTDATALYEKSLNDLEVAYAIYYFYAGKNIANYIKNEEKR
ncbi:MAG: TolC family protein [Campylobacterota bacterium]|nr:TolC family protein [Campylobacterota bacterium]